MKILYIAPASVNHTVRWVNAMVKRGHEVTLISLKEHSEGVNKIHPRVKIHYLPISGVQGYYLNFVKARAIINKIKPDIINTHYASGYGTLSRLINFKPSLLSVWGSDIYDFPKKSFFHRSILEKNLKKADYITSTSRAMAIETNKYTDENIYITPFGVDIKLFKKCSNENSSNNFQIKIGIVKTLKPKYGIEYLIKGISILIERLKLEGELDIIERLSCDIYGEGEEKKELLKLTKDLKVDDLINFKGYIENIKVPKVINTMDIFCAPSILDSESFGVAAVEAMACEVPVVVSDVDGFKEVVEDNVTGYIVPRKDPNAIAEKLYMLIEDKVKREEMGRNGRKRVEELYNWDINVREMEMIYRKIIEGYVDGK